MPAPKKWTWEFFQQVKDENGEPKVGCAKCLCCQQSRCGFAWPERQVNHLMTCQMAKTKLTVEQLEKLSKNGSNNNDTKKRRREVIPAPSTPSFAVESNSSKKRPNPPLPPTPSPEPFDQIDFILAKSIYLNNSSHLLQDEGFKSFVESLNPKFDFEKLRAKTLERLEGESLSIIEENRYSCLNINGSSSLQRTLVTAAAFVLPQGVFCFVHAKVKSQNDSFVDTIVNLIAKCMKKTEKKIENVACVVDNIHYLDRIQQMAKQPNLFFISCSIHCLSTFIQSMVNLEFFKEAMNSIIELADQYNCDSCFRNEFKKSCEKLFKNGRSFLASRSNRWLSVHHTVKFLLDAKQSIMSNKSSKLRSEQFWESVKMLDNLLDPVINLINILQESFPTASDVYFLSTVLFAGFFSKENFRFLSHKERLYVCQLAKRTHKAINTGALEFAFLLDPRFQNENVDVMPLQRREELLEEIASHPIFSEMTPAAVHSNYIDFINLVSDYDDRQIQKVFRMHPFKWWNGNLICHFVTLEQKSLCPNLKKLALKLFSINPVNALNDFKYSVFGVMDWSRFNNYHDAIIASRVHYSSMQYKDHNHLVISFGNDMKKICFKLFKGSAFEVEPSLSSLCSFEDEGSLSVKDEFIENDRYESAIED